MSDEKIDTFDEKNGGGLASGKAPTPWQGPRRKAPAFYAGETYGTKKMPGMRLRFGRKKVELRVPRRINYPDMERYANGAHPGRRNKFMRRVIRGALKRRFSKFERDLKLPRAMLEQARDVARDRDRQNNVMTSRAARGRFARRLFAKELAIHHAQPNEPSRAQRRAYQKALKKQGQKDAIAQLVDSMTTGEP